jgi:hypothetical protein
MILESHARVATDKLLRALEHDNADLDEYARSYLRHIAEAIEQQVRTGAADALGPYRERVRSLAFNVARNAQLQARLCRRELGAAELCAMSAVELITDAERTRRNAAAREGLRRATRNEWADAPRTSSHPCPRCASVDDVAFEHVGGTRDIRKAETWGGGGQANESDCLIRFGCLKCGHDWTSE